MADWLILRLPRSPDTQSSWLLCDGDGQPQATPENGALDVAAEYAAGRRLGVVVPTGDVLLTEVELPVKGGVRAQQVVAYALEEQLASEIETLHFALGERDSATARTAVAVVSRPLLLHWLEQLREAGMSADVLCDEATLLPDNPGHTLLLLDADSLCVRRAGRPAASLPLDDIAGALQAILGEDLALADLICYATPADWQRRGREVDALRGHCASLKVQLLPAGALPLLAPSLTAGGGINLLTEDYAPARESGGHWQHWRLAAMLALALFAVHVAGLSLQLLQQHRSERALDGAISDFAHSSIPGDDGQGAVRARVERKLLAAQSQSTNSGLMSALSALGGAIGNANGASVQALTYHDGGLELKLRASDAESLERIDQALRTTGWQADLTSGAASGSAYEGRIQMRPIGVAGRTR